MLHFLVLLNIQKMYDGGFLKVKKPHGFKPCIVISVYLLDVLSIEKLQIIVIIDELTS